MYMIMFKGFSTLGMQYVLPLKCIKSSSLPVARDFLPLQRYLDRCSVINLSQSPIRSIPHVVSITASLSYDDFYHHRFI